MKNFKLSPSDLTFLYEGCQRCFWLKVKRGIVQPSIPIPGIFSKIGGLLKVYYSGKRTDKVHPALPPGLVKYGEQWVQSQPISFDGHDNTAYIKGRFDIVAEFDDKTYGVIDFKTGNPNEEYIDLYSRQLHAYAYALEHPAGGALSLSPVTKLGLLYFYPEKISQTDVDWLSYDAEIKWVEIPKDEERFLEFISGVLDLLESPELPDPAPGCQWCDYRAKMKNVE